MINRFQPSLRRLNQLVDWFIPSELAADPEACKQARMFLFSHIFGPFIGNVVPAAVFVLDPHPTFDVAVLALSITAFWAFPFALRRFGHYDGLVLLSVQNLIFCILWSCYFYGGVSSPTVSWVLTIPLLAFFYIGPNSPLRLTVLGLFVVNVIAFIAILQWHPLDGKALPVVSMQALGIVSTTCTAVYVTMMAIYYAKTLASGAEIESEMKRHLATAAELRRATAEMERAGAAKSEFLAKMSHELRTPLNAIIGYSQMLLEDAPSNGDDEVSVLDLKRINSAGQQLLRLINEILDLSKIEAGKMELFNETVGVSELVTRAAESCLATIEKYDNTLVLELAQDLGSISCDAGKVEHAIKQLLDNAAKFTSDGRITISAKRRFGSPSDEIDIAIRDTGIGISPEAMPVLFEFGVADDTSATKYGGTGLGLALSQRLCRLMGGTLTAQSEVGVGSCFTIRLPAQPPAAPAKPAPSEPEFSESNDARSLSFAA